MCFNMILVWHKHCAPLMTVTDTRLISSMLDVYEIEITTEKLRIDICWKIADIVDMTLTILQLYEENPWNWISISNSKFIIVEENIAVILFWFIDVKDIKIFIPKWYFIGENYYCSSECHVLCHINFIHRTLNVKSWTFLEI